MAVDFLAISKGSSPRVWGQDIFTKDGATVVGIIPTRVGTSCVLAAVKHFRWDHPHACGDKVRLASPETSILGSSPRVWGQDTEYSVCCPSVRIIPTRVGTRTVTKLPNTSKRDHPHACGDKSIRVRRFWKTRGSSPRVWGQGRFSNSSSSSSRIIPTRVGTRIKRQKLKAI